MVKSTAKGIQEFLISTFPNTDINVSETSYVISIQVQDKYKSFIFLMFDRDNITTLECNTYKSILGIKLRVNKHTYSNEANQAETVFLINSMREYTKKHGFVLK